MVKLEEINSTSTFAWSLDCLPLLVAGTVAGAVDINFNSSTKLEIWDIFSATDKTKPIFTADVAQRFYSIGWSKPFANYEKGIIVGAFENGSIVFWDAAKLIQSKDLSQSQIHSSDVHKGPVKSVQFNPIQNNILVTGGSNGQIFIWNCENFSEAPFSPGQAMTPMDEITCVAWNNTVSHIFASTGNGGYTSVWDLKSKREVLHLLYTDANGSRASFSHVAWHPTQSTKLVTASDNDSCPVILSWDLRNANEPERILTGHKKGVLSLDWCKQDPELLISSGKDNNTSLWNPISGQKLAEYPTTANWTFHTRFAPSAPDIFATASFDGKIIVQSLQDTSPPVCAKVSSKDDNTFWNQLSTTETQQPTFQVKQAPQWLKRPSSVSFGFGSKLVIVSKDADGKSIVKVTKVSSSTSSSSESLVKALNSNDFNEIIDAKLESEVDDNEKADWEVLKTLAHSSKEALFKETNPEVETDKAEPVSNGDKKQLSDDSFFENLESELKTTADYIPEGEFKIFGAGESEEDKKLIKLILNKKLDQAVDLCLKQDKLSEAFILALDGSDAIKQKVKNVYFKNNSKNTLSRVLYNSTSNNVTDIVSHADVENWKEIASSISSFSNDSDEFNSKITELGDRLLKSKDNKEQRDNAIRCYLAGNAIDKIAAIWLKELPEFESKLLKSESSSISTPSEARIETLTNFVQKVAAYRSICKESGVLAGPAAEQISRAILEYCNLIAGSGEFELAELFLNILPTEFAGVEKDRILKAVNKPVQNVAATTSKAASSRGVPTRTNNNSPAKSGYTPAVSVNSFTPQPTVPTNSFIPPAMTPPVPNTFSGATSRPQVPPFPQASVPVPQSNPYARTNPYTPQASNNIYRNAVQPNATVPGITSPPPAPPKKTTNEGWNDLPDTFKKSAPPRRAASAQTQSPVPTPSSFPVQPAAKIAPSNNVGPPPPKGMSRKSSSSSVPLQASSPVPTPPQISNRYAPPPGTTVEAPLTPGAVSNASFGSPSQPKKNPYAPSVESNVTPKASFPQPPGVNAIAPPTFPAAAPPPKNPYAPPPQGSTPKLGGASGFAPSSGGIAPPPTQAFSAQPQPVGYGSVPQNQYANPPPVNPSFPPPPMGPSAGTQNGSKQVPPPPPAIGQQPVAVSTEPERPSYPAGDRSHIPESSLPIFQSFTGVLEAIKPRIPEKYEKHAQDMEKRLNFLFDHLNNEDLLSSDAISSLKQVSEAVQAKDFTTAISINNSIATNYPEEVGHWHTGVKRLITMAEAMY